MSDKFITSLLFQAGDARAAAEFYAATFPDSQVKPAFSAESDHEVAVEFSVCGRHFLGINGGPECTPNESVSFMILTDDQAETDRLWDAIVSNGGEESMCGWCKDRWGFSWQITPRALMDAMKDPDRAASAKAMDAMMTMRKINIATIEAARKS